MFLTLKKFKETRTSRDLLDFLLHRGMRPTWLILVLCLIATGTVSWAAWSVERESTAQAFDATTARIVEEIETVMESYQHLLRAGAGLLSVGGNIGEDEWGDFTKVMDLERQFPGVQGIGFTRVVAKDDIPRHTSEMRQRGKAGYTLFPAGDRETYTAIEFLEPRTWRNQRAIGFDMYSEPTRRAAMMQARETGQPVITRGVRLMQETDENIQAGVLMYVPVFRSKASVSGNGEPSARFLHGYMYAAFRMTNLFTQEVRSQLPGLFKSVSVRIWDRSPDPTAVLLYDSHAGLAPPEKAILQIDRDVPIAGQQWHMEFSALPTFQTVTRWARPVLVLIAGLIMSALITAIAATLALARSQAVAAQRELSQEVVARKAAQRQVQVANQELIHRVKNVMAVVTAIAAQTQRYTPDPIRFNSVFRERLAALGRVHDLLTVGPTSRPDIAVLVSEILKPYRDEPSSRLDIGGPSIVIGDSAAVMLSLVLNELATNAIKYGAWSQEAGKIEVRWLLEHEGDRDIVAMTWQETGGPKVDEPTHRGFGVNVLKFAIEQGLRGTFEPRYLEDGLKCCWRFPRVPAISDNGGAETRSY